ncbi:MAG: putative photosynthetic complex assembly protein PuhE [Acetobacteraceae bacterium]
MAEYLAPALFTIFMWWFCTGVIFVLDGLPARSFRWSMAGATLMLGAAFGGIWISAADTSLAGAYVAFSSALLVWGWQEIAFLTGTIVGPYRKPCPDGLSGYPRFALAVRALLHHEIAILLLAAGVLLMTWDGANQVALWTFLLLWAARTSTKLNIFLGVRNFAESFLPAHLGYMTSFFRRRPMNLLFPLSVTVSTVGTLLLFQAAFAAETPFAAASLTLLGTLAALAVLEHWFLMLPIPFEALWSWAGRFRGRQPAPSPRAPDGSPLPAVASP